MAKSCRESVIMSLSKKPVGVSEIFIARLPTRTEWRYDPINSTLYVFGSDFATDLRVVRNRILQGQIGSNLNAIVYRGVFVLRGRHLDSWLSGFVPSDPND